MIEGVLNTIALSLSIVALVVSVKAWRVLK